MYNLSGIEYRLWAVGGIFILLGIFGLLMSGIGTQKLNKELILASVLCILLGIWQFTTCLSTLLHPQISSKQLTFCYEYRNSRVAPPLPYTMEYTFRDHETGVSTALYLDVLSKKEIYNKDFEENKVYIIHYEEKNNIIVGVEEVNSD